MAKFMLLVKMVAIHRYVIALYSQQQIIGEGRLSTSIARIVGARAPPVPMPMLL